MLRSSRVTASARAIGSSLIESVFALWKYSWMENGLLLAKKETDHYPFLLSFLSEPEAERFEENFSQDEVRQYLAEFSLEGGRRTS